MPRMSAPLTAALLGVALALCSLPLEWGFAAPLPLAALLLFAAQPLKARAVAARMWWAGTAYSAVHLWWLTAFLGKLFGFPPAGALALALYALEGAFLAAMAFLGARLVQGSLARVWVLAGLWVGLEWLRFLGPLAFPWPTLGYSLLPTPMIQVADLGGVLLGSVIVAGTAAALVSFWLDRRTPLLLMSAVWVGALAYGITRTPAQGPEARALLQRNTIDTFARASRQLNSDEQFATYLNLSRDRRPGELLIWSESAIWREDLLRQAPANGLYGTISFTPDRRANRVVAWDGTRVTSTTDKARPVPFGEYYPLRRALAPFWSLIERSINISLESVPAAENLRPLTLGGVTYGAYVCYDSVFPWVSRQLSNKGAQVLVNASNDGWYDGWGVEQHFLMGRVRAIENRRWVLRSVNEGVAAVIDDLGRPRQVLRRGEGIIHARYRLLSGQTVYQRVGDLPALLLAALMVLYGVGLDRAGRRS
ncbi:apolipoprotein N-acyltransferase [Deinococcus navajonensis]|uniref:Apolipoprotein N-acyltransferase n=1 Tax=Deinococcus navajonensis TaxID=309884 RepID=A0ABV8XIW5_9DEIO